MGGTGKSVLINILITVIRIIFEDNNVIYVCGQTGCSAHGVGGETMHRFFGARIKSNNMSPFTRDKLLKMLCATFFLVFDEQSLISSELLGKVETNCQQTAHSEMGTSERFGGIPFVILVGDDY